MHTERREWRLSGGPGQSLKLLGSGGFGADRLPAACAGAVAWPTAGVPAFVPKTSRSNFRWRGGDAFRTLVLVPPPEVRAVLERVRDLKLAA